MRLSSLTLAVVLLLSSFSFAQHGAPSSPAPSPAPVAAPAPPPPPPPPPPAPAPSPAPAPPSVSHTSMPSAPAPSIPVTHIAPIVNSSSAPSAPRAPESNSVRPAPVGHNPEAGRVTSEQKVSEEGRIVPALRVGEKPPEREPEKKLPESNLRRPICHGENCQESAKKPEPPDSDLRRPVCGKGPCPCPAGQVAGKGGCVVSQSQAFNQCQPGQSWNGANCSTILAECANVNAMLQTAIFELRSLRTEARNTCMQNPNSSACQDAQIREQDALLRYRDLLNSADPACRGGWSWDPL